MDTKTNPRCLIPLRSISEDQKISRQNIRLTGYHGGMDGLGSGTLMSWYSASWYSDLLMLLM
jgi:hypothetical protein